MSTVNDFHYVDNQHDVLAVYVNRLLDSTMRSEYKNVETLSATRTLLDADTPIQRFECGAADRIVQMPTADAVNNHPFFIVNASAAARTLTVKDNAGAVILMVLAQGEACLAMPDGNGGYKCFIQDAPADGTPYARKDHSWITVSIKETDYKITPTVASNNLTLTLTHMDGTTPSAGRPLWVKIGTTWRAIVAALSVVKNAGMNWANLGSEELKNKETDPFAYLIWNSNLNAVDIFWSRIPYGTLYSDFSATTTDEKYAAINATAPASTDECVNIGRFAATLSAGAGYTWTIPTFTNKNLIQRPIYETRWLTWQAVYTGFSADPVHITEYKIIGSDIHKIIDGSANGTSNATGFTMTMPFKALTILHGALGLVIDNGSVVAPGYWSIPAGSIIATYTKSAGAAWTASGSKLVYYEGFYKI